MKSSTVDIMQNYVANAKALGIDADTAMTNGLEAAKMLLGVGVPVDQLPDTARKFAQEYAQYGLTRIEKEERATRHRLTSGLVDILTNIAKTVHEKNRNDIHLYQEVTEVCGPQAYAQLSNITKLRFHALVFKVKNEDGKQIKGHWGITKRGGQFLRGEIEIPEFTITQGNRVVGREGKDIHIKALRPEGPVEFEQREDITYVPMPAPEPVKHQPKAVSWLKD